jgi:hypothetical protein
MKRLNALAAILTIVGGLNWGWSDGSSSTWSPPCSGGCALAR